MVYNSFLPCADPSGTQLKLPETELDHESTILKYSLSPRSPTGLSGAQPGDRPQMKMVSTAWKQYAKQLSGHTETVHLYESLSDHLLQAKGSSFQFKSNIKSILDSSCHMTPSHPICRKAKAL